MMEVAEARIAQNGKVNQQVRFRLAKYPDAGSLADLHYVCSLEQPVGFMYLLGRNFLTAYYRILLSNRSSLVICAEALNGRIVGLISLTSDSAEEFKSLHDSRFRLLLSALPTLIMKPRLMASVSMRANSLSMNGDGFVNASGARLTYWGWSPDYHSRGSSTKLLLIAMKLLKTLGVETVRTEVDLANRKSIMMNRFMGGKVVEEFVTKDGRKRLIIEHRLK